MPNNWDSWQQIVSQHSLGDRHLEFLTIEWGAFRVLEDGPPLHLKIWEVWRSCHVDFSFDHGVFILEKLYLQLWQEHMIEDTMKSQIITFRNCQTAGRGASEPIRSMTIRSLNVRRNDRSPMHGCMDTVEISDGRIALRSRSRRSMSSSRPANHITGALHSHHENPHISWPVGAGISLEPTNGSAQGGMY